MDSERTKKVRKSWRKHEITVVLIDVGRNMAAVSNERSQTALDLAKETIDWIITRKIFSESVDEFTLVLFGSDETRNSCLHGIGNIFFCEEELQTAQIDWLRKIENEFKLSSDAEGDYLNALIVAIEYIRLSLETMEEAEKASVTARNILILSNLAGSKADTSNTRIDEINAVVNGIKALDINLNIIGLSSVFLLHNTVSNCEQSQESRPSTNEHDFTLDSSKGFIKMEDGEKVVRQILRDVGGTAFSFSEALPMLQHFIPRTSDVRGQRFYFELAEDFRLPLMLYKKVQENNLKMKFAKYDSRTDLEIKRETVFEKPADKSQCGSQIPHCSANQTLTKADVVKGYLFGKSVMPFNEEDEKEYGWKRETRCLKLIQFTKRSNILQQYLMDGAAYYCIPDYENQEACTAVAALVDGMIAENVVALVRFVYNASSVPRLCGLFPRLNKKGAHVCDPSSSSFTN
ncbi:hypothetical protein AB6A40_001186 [Gnathostoma spinigerum]|uniref:Ku domain-containing protein n=1 Tax=Gnathostoma spinigerum TaxID=75299 RepID=A0ABD6ECQ7_9BILA